METISIFVSILAGILQLVGYWIYNQGIWRGEIKPNSATWFLWALGSGIATCSYVSISNDWVKNILPIACAIACIGTFLFSLVLFTCKKATMESPDKYDWLIIFLDVMVVVFWMATGMKEEAHLLLQLDLILSFIPIIKHTFTNPEDEKPIPWIFWCTAYVFMILSIAMRFEDWLDFVYPITYLVLCLAIVLILRLRKTT